ncbi:MAG: hypothetical protein AB8B65_15895 [Kordia sp.]|uniref:alginate O-acetyltransferase AlgX-related protein n=1 Tax=Kordia sp. TaxID=1965332 RepID=UPI00385A2F1E
MKDKKMTPEEIATMEIGSTDISKTNQKILVAFFLIFIVSAVIVQFLFSTNNETFASNNSDIKNDQTIAESSSFLKTMTDFNAGLGSDIKQFESDIEENAVYRKTMIPITQTGLVRIFNTGNENAWLTKDNFYYKYSNQYLTQPGFLDRKQLQKRAKENIQPNPLKAILHFNESLAKRNIQLIILPAPPKAAFLLKNDVKALNNNSYAIFVKQLQKEGIVVCDVFELLENQNFENSGYLKYDTHWSPEAMKMVANKVSELLDSLSIAKGNIDYNTKKLTVQNHGDIVDMLTIENKDNLFKRQSIEIEQILEENFLFKPATQSDILFLGDSYANIYSLEGMNWGSAAGLSEHISKNMRKPVDRIQMNDAGAYATRLALSNELKRGKNRLAGKKVVIWEFAARELSVGDWKLIDMKLNEDYVSEFFVPKEDTSHVVTGIVSETSQVPMPNSVPYKDHVVSVHITNLKEINTGKELGEAVVYLSSMENNNWTAAAQLRNGQEIKLKLYNWNDYTAEFGPINRSELQDDELSFADPCWGVLLKK